MRAIFMQLGAVLDDITDMHLSQKQMKILGAIVGICLIVGVLVFMPRSPRGTVDWSDERAVFDVSLPANASPAERERFDAKLVEARQLYETAFDDSWTYTVLGNLYKFVSDYDMAIKAYERVLELETGNIGARMNLATIYTKYADPVDYDRAEYYYRQNIEFDANNAGSYLPLAELLWQKKGDAAAAEEVYNMAVLNVGEDNADLLIAMINFYKESGNDEKAVETAKKLLTVYPNDPLYKETFGSLVQ